MVYFKMQRSRRQIENHTPSRQLKLRKQRWHLQSSAYLLERGCSFNVCCHLSLCTALTGRTTFCAFSRLLQGENVDRDSN